MRELSDRAWGAAFSRVGDLALTSFDASRLLFAPGLTGPTRQWIAERRARAVFWNARRRVPGYREFLRAAGRFEPRSFQEIPIMDKQSYIQRYPLEALCQ